MEVQAEPDMIELHRNVSPCSGKAHGSEALAGSSTGWFCQQFKVLDLLDISYDLVDGQVEADGEAGADRQTTDSTTEEKD